METLDFNEKQWKKASFVLLDWTSMVFETYLERSKGMDFSKCLPTLYWYFSPSGGLRHHVMRPQQTAAVRRSLRRVHALHISCAVFAGLFWTQEPW